MVDSSILVRRVGAYVLDIALLFTVLAPVGYIVQRTIGVIPVTAQGVYAALVLNFSLPVWAYFALADHSMRGATFGKRWLSLRTRTAVGGRVGTGQALLRTAVKMVPWEVAHASAFLIPPALGEFGLRSWLGIGTSYALMFAYLIVAWRTRGRQSIHDVAARTRVEPVASTSAGE